MSSPITTHVLDTAHGRPAKRVRATLSIEEAGVFREIARGETNDDGRIPDLLAPGALQIATYRITFHTGEWFEAEGVRGFYPFVDVVFAIDALDRHYHVPLLISPYGYSTYRGS